MGAKPILIHFHFHKRRTGVTSSIESVLPYFTQDFKTFVFGDFIGWDKISFSSIIKLVLKRQYFIIHVHRNNEILRALFLKSLCGNFKLVATRHAESKPTKMTLYLLSKVDEVVSLTQSMKDQLPLKSNLISHGINTDWFEPKNGVRISGVSQQNIICIAGRVRERKGHEIFFKAVSPFFKKFKDWAVVIVGKIDDLAFYEKLKSIIKNADIEDQVYFLPENKNIKTFYQASKISVIPSFSEGFSLVCLEAMACGSTVIATRNVGVHSDVIISVEHGFLFPSGDAVKLKEILFDILSGREKLIENKGRQQIIDHWSAKMEAESLVKLYKK